MKNNPKIRFATIDDLPSIVEIYNQAIRSKKATADLTEFKVEERVSWFNKFNDNQHPIYVAEINNKVVGYASLSPYRPGRKALDKIVEITFYINYSFHGLGIGSSLVKYVIIDCKRLGKETLLAILLDINTGSIKLLQKFNFKEWGNLPLNSNFGGKRFGHLYYGLNLN
jgi:phosphinothricin acetyltransferase